MPCDETSLKGLHRKNPRVGAWGEFHRQEEQVQRVPSLSPATTLWVSEDGPGARVGLQGKAGGRCDHFLQGSVLTGRPAGLDNLLRSLRRLPRTPLESQGERVWGCVV